MLLLDARGNAAKFSPGLREAYARLQAPDHVNILAAAAGFGQVGGRERRRRPDIAGTAELENRLDDAHHAIAFLAELDVPSDDGRIRAVAALPQSFRDDGDVILAVL